MKPGVLMVDLQDFLEKHDVEAHVGCYPGGRWWCQLQWRAIPVAHAEGASLSVAVGGAIENYNKERSGR